MALFVDARASTPVTVADVAPAADVSEKTVFNYFPAKEDLVLHAPTTGWPNARSVMRPPGVPLTIFVRGRDDGVPGRARKSGRDRHADGGAAPGALERGAARPADAGVMGARAVS